MATTARLEDENGKWTSVHWDGYPTGVGATLLRWYNDPQAAAKLIATPAIRQLRWDGTVDQYQDRKSEPCGTYTYRWDGHKWIVKGPDHRWQDLGSMPKVQQEIQRRLKETI